MRCWTSCAAHARADGDHADLRGRGAGGPPARVRRFIGVRPDGAGSPGAGGWAFRVHQPAQEPPASALVGWQRAVVGDQAPGTKFVRLANGGWCLRDVAAGTAQCPHRRLGGAGEGRVVPAMRCEVFLLDSGSCPRPRLGP